MRFSLRTLLLWFLPGRECAVLQRFRSRATDRARAALRLGEREARRLKQAYVGTEHLLFGILNDDGVAPLMLQELGINLDRVRIELAALMLPGEASERLASLPVTPTLKRTLELAAEEARLLHHDHPGTEHLVLALLSEPQGIAHAVLTKLDHDPATL